MTGNAEPVVTLREHFDDKVADIKADISEMKQANAEEHSAVLTRLGTLEKELTEKLLALDDKFDGVVTWKSLGGSIAVIGGLVGMIAGLAKLLGVG